MSSPAWLPAVVSYVIESILETAVVYVAVFLALAWLPSPTPAVRYRFLMLPLAIPVLFSPILHVIFPGLSDTALVTHLERMLPVLERLRSQGQAIAPVLLASFALLVSLNVARTFAVSLREVRATRLAGPPPLAFLTPTSTRLAARLRVPRPAFVVSKRRPVSAYSYGWRRPVITLGVQWIGRLEEEELLALLAHELAHFRRGDTWTTLVANVCRDLMYFNPLAHSVCLQLGNAREEAADDLAVQATGDAPALASCLLKVSCDGQMSSPLPVGHALGATSSTRADRIRRLVELPGCRPLDKASGAIFYSLAIALTLALSLV